MAACRALDCGKPSGRRILCRECAKALQPGELWTLRMATESPMHFSTVRADDSSPTGLRGSIGGWGDSIDGSERMRVHFEENGLPCWTTAAGVGPINDVLQWLEFDLAAWACAAAITARRKAKADRRRLAELRRVTSPRRR